MLCQRPQPTIFCVALPVSTRITALSMPGSHARTPNSTFVRCYGVLHGAQHTAIPWLWRIQVPVLGMQSWIKMRLRRKLCGRKISAILAWGPLVSSSTYLRVMFTGAKEDRDVNAVVSSSDPRRYFLKDSTTESKIDPVSTDKIANFLARRVCPAAMS